MEARCDLENPRPDVLVALDIQPMNVLQEIAQLVV
jgi:hypothetical protein